MIMKRDVPQKRYIPPADLAFDYLLDVHVHRSYIIYE